MLVTFGIPDWLFELMIFPLIGWFVILGDWVLDAARLTLDDTERRRRVEHGFPRRYARMMADPPASDAHRWIVGIVLTVVVWLSLAVVWQLGIDSGWPAGVVLCVGIGISYWWLHRSPRGS